MIINSNDRMMFSVYISLLNINESDAFVSFYIDY